MNTTKLFNKGQEIIPTAQQSETGLDLVVINTDDGVLLKQKKPFKETTLDNVVACLKYSGKTKTLEEMEQAIKKATQGYFESF